MNSPVFVIAVWLMWTLCAIPSVQIQCAVLSGFTPQAVSFLQSSINADLCIPEQLFSINVVTDALCFTVGTPVSLSAAPVINLVKRTSETA